MQKKSLLKWLGYALAATLCFTGCDSGGGDSGIVAGGDGISTTGGGTTTTTTTSTTGFGITGGSMTGAFGGTGTGSGSGSGTGTSTGTGTATGTGTGTGGGGFLGPVTPSDLRSGLNNPTAFATVLVGGQPKTFFVDGFRAGQSLGRLLSVDTSAAAGPSGLPLQIVQANTGSPLTAQLNSPFDMVSDGANLYITTGFGFPADGAIIRVSQFQVVGGNITARFENITAGVAFPVNPAFMTLVRITGTGDFVYWTEYSSAQTSGRVRRIRTNGSGTADIVVNNLNFPAGIDHDTERLAICDSGGGALGRVILTQINPTQLPINGADPSVVTEVTPITGQQAISRPFDIVWDGERGFFYTEGATIQQGGGPLALGPGNGAVRFIAEDETQARLISNGLNNAAGIDAVNSGGNVSSVLFSESAALNGRVLRRSVDTTNVTNIAPSVVDTGIDFPLMVGIASETNPTMVAIINYIGGVPNGIFRIYSP